MVQFPDDDGEVTEATTRKTQQLTGEGWPSEVDPTCPIRPQ